MTKLIKIGTRTSKLALAQANIVAGRLTDMGFDWEIVGINTTGDKLYDANLALIGGKGLFLKEIEEQLQLGNIDVAVHSMKDVPHELPNDLIIPAVLPREDRRDVFISNIADSFEELPFGARVGTTSARRRCEVLKQRPDLEVIQFRGNITTRLQKLDDGLVDACILAYAGLKRIDLLARVKQVLDPNLFLPAVGQGAIGIECRKSDHFMLDILSKLNCPKSYKEVFCERGFMTVLGGSCTVPLAASAEVMDDTISIVGRFYTADGRQLDAENNGDADDFIEVGFKAAKQIEKQF